MKHGERFVAAARQGLLPLVIWALHFFFAYGAVAAACDAGFAHVGALLLGATALAVVALSALAFSAWRALRDGGLLAGARLGAAVLALVAVLWAALPVPWLPPCGGVVTLARTPA
jgi:hypothetical protein